MYFYNETVYYLLIEERNSIPNPEENFFENQKIYLLSCYFIKISQSNGTNLLSKRDVRKHSNSFDEKYSYYTRGFC